MWFKVRSWTSVALSIFAMGISALLISVLLWNKENKFSFIVVLIAGIVITILGIVAIVVVMKKKYRGARFNIDKNLTYSFTLETEYTIETVHDFSQIVNALKRHEEQKSGFVRVNITPAMGGVESVETTYNSKNKYFYTYIRQRRDDKVFTWSALCLGTGAAVMDLKRLYLKHKMIDYSLHNRVEEEAVR